MHDVRSNGDRPLQVFRREGRLVCTYIALKCSFHCRASEEQLQMPRTSFQKRRKTRMYYILFFSALSIIGQVRSSCNCPPPVSKREGILVCIFFVQRCSFHCWAKVLAALTVYLGSGGMLKCRLHFDSETSWNYLQ